jgi:hypothetical protein
MKDQAIEIAGRETTHQAKRNRLREFLQHLLLRQLFERDILERLVFHGGTALRILHDLPRFSEDLDFHLAEPQKDYSLGLYLKDLERDLERSGYRVGLRPRLKGAVASCMFGFEKLPYECGLTPHPGEKLNIKLEIDINPPEGFQTETRLINAHFPIVVTHHDRPSFLAGKLHAISQRRFAKGRDFFDLLFFLSRWKDIVPNVRYLNNALRQTGYGGPAVTEGDWKKWIAGRLDQVDWAQVEREVEPFLLRPEDLKAFRKEFLLRLLES